VTGHSDNSGNGNKLPPFPVDDATLGMIEAALNPQAHGDPEATSSSIWPLLTMLSQLGGSDTTAVAEVLDDGGDGGASIVMMRDQHYHDNDMAAALVAEVRKLRAQRDAVLAYTAKIECPNCDHAVSFHDNHLGLCDANLNNALGPCGCDWTSSVAEDIRELHTTACSLPGQGEGGTR
jgi:hypothetical protein